MKWSASGATPWSFWLRRFHDPESLCRELCREPLRFPASCAILDAQTSGKTGICCERAILTRWKSLVRIQRRPFDLEPIPVGCVSRTNLLARSGFGAFHAPYRDRPTELAIRNNEGNGFSVNLPEVFRKLERHFAQ